MANRYLEGNFGPVREELTLTELEVTGTIPAHLDGRYLRNGPNPLGAPDPATYHWFTGTGMVHGVRLRDGRAEWYRNRWVRSREVSAALGDPPPRGPVHGGFDFGGNTNVIGHAGRTFAIVESGPLPYELTDELDTIGSCDFDGTLGGGYTAHPKRDPETGELHAVSYFWAWGNKVRYTVLGTDGRIRRRVDIRVTGLPMMHDFSLTERHVVLYDLPVTFDTRMATATMPKALARPAGYLMPRLLRRGTPERIAARVMSGSSSAFPYVWDPSYPPWVGVMPRDGGAADVRWFDVEPCYVYHPLNAYDDGDQVVLDVVRHPKMFATDRRGPNEGDPTLDRWTVDLIAGKVLEERLDDRGQEFPRVDERLVGRRHRYGYTAGFSGADEGGGAAVRPSEVLLKHDLVARTTQVRSLGANTAVGEFVFVPAHVDAGENEGLVMGFVYEGDTDRSALLLLDAGSLETVARIQLPTRVPHGFHGNWVPTR